MSSRKFRKPQPALGVKPTTLTKPQFIKCSELDPESKGINLILKVVEVKTILERKKLDGHPVTIGEALVGDSSASILLTWRNEQGSFLKPGQCIYVRNGKVEMFKNHMRLAVDKWGLMEVATDLDSQQVQEQVNTAINLSDTEYELINVPA